MRRPFPSYRSSQPSRHSCRGKRARSRAPVWLEEGSMTRLPSVVWLAGFLLLSPAQAQEQETRANKLEGTLAKVDRTGAITLGYREASFPLSYLSKAGPIGYSIDLCLAVVEEIKREIDRTDIEINYKPVTPETRIAAVKSGEVDIECGSTTAN